MSGRSLIHTSLLLLALGTAAPGAAQVIEDPHWRRTASSDVRPPLDRIEPSEARGRPLPDAGAPPALDR